MRLLRILIAVWVASVATANASTITAASCASTAVQAAINSAARGDTVVIPNGSCTWTSGVTISGKGIIVHGQSQAGVVITDNVATYGITLTEDTSFHTQISNMTVTGSGVFIWVLPFSTPTDTGQAVLIHDLVAHDTAVIRLEANRGVIYSNTVTGSNSLGDNIEFVQCKSPSGLTTSWTTASTMGTTDTTGQSNSYIEDNTFTDVLQAVIDVDDNCRTVIRHNTFNNSAMASHGADTSFYGNRHAEIYDNTFIFTDHSPDCVATRNIPYFIFWRGGTGLLTNNTGLVNMSSNCWGSKPALVMTLENLGRDAGADACWGLNTTNGANYHAPRQPGFGRVTGTGTDGLGRTNDSITYVGDSEPFYIWNQNLTPSLTNYDDNGTSFNSCVVTHPGSVPDTVNHYLVSGRDFINDGTAKPGWTRYTYPHPLRSGSGSGAPAAPSNLHLVP
jgi:hypothetical protein